MSAAALNIGPNLSFEDFRNMAHSKLDESLDKIKPLFFSEEVPTLQEISDVVQEMKQDISGHLVQEAANNLNQTKLVHAFCHCPSCKKPVKKMRDTSRRIETRHGSSLISKPYFYCSSCQLGFSPVDETLELSSRKKQHDLQQLALKFLARMPFEEAAELFYESTGVTFSDHCMHELFASFAEDIGPDNVIPEAGEIAYRIEQASIPGKRRPVLVVATDGAHMPTRPGPGRDTKRGPGEYKEAKGFRIYLNSNDRITHLASWHQISDKDEITKALNTAASRIPVDKVRIALIGDGASWLWDAMTQAFPSGRQILDYYHVSQYIHKVADLQYSSNPNKALHWVESTMARLCFNKGASRVIAGLKRMQPASEEAKEQIRKTINYLEKNKHRIHYRGDRIGGYPIGSGGVESANKFICHVRLKRSGAWWLKSNGNKMLALRCAMVNGTFDQIFSGHVTKEKAKRFLTNG
jgi:hypothetical protein